MIEIKNLDKYFNKGKTNQLHVIQNTNLTFPETGLFCLLGSSGSGKTTLLNVIGGLDSANNGEIIYDNVSIKKYQSNKWDMLRNHHFGYIFQNYILLPDLTVYQNLEFVLKMLNLDKNEIDERIEYALKAVGMFRYKKRKPTQLSGGQQQRVAIARALVKSPNVVIADEPTGNLDDKNTKQIMNIIKKISKECLVILVTHDKRLAKFYGDTIIEISDGKVLQQYDTVKHNKTIELEDNNVYLQEYINAKLTSEEVNIDYFYEEKSKKLDLIIILKNDTFYIKSKQDSVKIQYITNDNEMKIIDSKKPIITQESVDASDYHLPKIKEKCNSKSTLSFKDTFSIAISHIHNLRKKQKILFLVFILAQIIVLMGFISLASTKYVDEKDFLIENRNLVALNGTKQFTAEDFFNLETKLNSKILWEAKALTITKLDFKLYTQFPFETTISKNSLLPISILNEPNLILGSLPETYGEIVIDLFLVNQMLKDINITGTGILLAEQFIGATYYNNYFHCYGKVVGIVNTNNPNIYMYDNEYMISAINHTQNVDNWTSRLYGIEATCGITEYYSYPSFQKIPFTGLEKNEVLISSRRLGLMNPDGTIKLGGETSYNVVGIYDYNVEVKDYHINQYILSEEDLKLVMTEMFNKGPFSYPSVYSEFKKELISNIEAQGLTAINIYEQDLLNEEAEAFNESIFSFALIILLASMVFLYFFMRSSLISRIYAVGVYRALGVKKSNIYKLFASEIFLITLITSFIGILLVSLLIMEVNKIYFVFYYPWYLVVFAFAFMLICNLIVGLLPVIRLLRLTPSQILTKYDI